MRMSQQPKWTFDDPEANSSPMAAGHFTKEEINDLNAIYQSLLTSINDWAKR